MDYKDINFAKLDLQRQKRRGYPEAVFLESKTDEQIIKIFKTFMENGQNVIGTRGNEAQFKALQKEIEKVKFNKEARTITLELTESEKLGEVAVVTGGTGDIPVAEEAASVAEFYGSKVKKYYDMGVAGLQRLLNNIEEIKRANVIVAVAGMEGALAGIIAGLVDIPVIAVPTSIGYGAAFEGLSALLTMVNSCAEGITVTNIDGGFNAGYSANQINRLIAKGKN